MDSKHTVSLWPLLLLHSASPFIYNHPEDESHSLERGLQREMVGRLRSDFRTALAVAGLEVPEL